MSKKNRKAEKKLIKSVIDWYNDSESDADLFEAVELYADTVNGKIEGEGEDFWEEDYVEVESPTGYHSWGSLAQGLKDAAEGRVVYRGSFAQYADELDDAVEAAVKTTKDVVAETVQALSKFFKI